MTPVRLLLLLIVPFVSAHECDAESLIQNSFAVMSKNGHRVEDNDLQIRQMSSAQLQLYSDLQSAKRAQQQALASLKHWNDRISALEASLATSMQDNGGMAASAPQNSIVALLDSTVAKVSMVKSSCSLVLLAILVLYMLQTVYRYQANRDKELDPPWYFDTGCMMKVFVSGAVLWLVAGISMFTQFMHFTDSKRSLTVIESLYVTAQMVTTVGYGDLTPTTNRGKMFMAFYALTGVTLIGGLIQQFLFMNADQSAEDQKLLTPRGSSKHHLLGKYHKYVMGSLPVLGSVLFGTIFYSVCPGENKNLFEAFYMSIISLTTIGFGAYHPETEVGKLVGAVWLVVGVSFVGEAIVNCTKRIFRKRVHFRTKAAAMKLFKEIDTDGSGTIDRKEFLTFELVRNGVEQAEAVRAFDMFDRLDADGSGTLDYEEFEEYVKNL